MATMVPAQKNVEYIFYTGLVSQADTKLLQNNPTLAAGDVLVSTDGGATSNLDTLPAVTPASSDMVKVTVSATEMNGDNTIIVFSDAAGSEWCDKLICIQTAAQSLDTMDTNIDDIETDTGTTIPATITTLQTTATAIDDLTKASGGGDLASVKGTVEAIPTTAMRGTDNVVLAGPTKAEMDTAHALLATPANVATELGTYDAATGTELGITEAKIDTLQDDMDTLVGTQAEPTSPPAATSSLLNRVGWLFALARNKITQTSTTQTLRNDADGGNIATSTVSDDGTTATRAEWS